MGVLSGYRVIDLTDEKGMLCARLMADMGADVIRVEKPGAVSADTGEACYLNAGKRSITLDLEKPNGQVVFKRLIGTADVLIETGSPGYLASLGLGYHELSGINRRLIMASITGFGQEGPGRDYKCCDIVAEAMGGWLSVTGEARAPLKLYGNQSYYTASLFAANGILLALLDRHAAGEGQYMDISLVECVAATLDYVLPRYFYEGVISQRQGSRHWNGAFRVFPCKDGYVLLSLLLQWETLVEWLKSEGMAGDLDDEEWLDRETRIKGLEHIEEIIESWTLSHTASELVEKGQLMRFPWAGVSSVSDLAQSPQLIERGYFTGVTCPVGERRYRVPAAPCRMSRTPWRVGDKAPAPGEHNTQIFRELGLPPEGIEEA